MNHDLCILTLILSILEENNFTLEWRLLHYDSKYLITWGCFNRGKDYRCTDWASGVFRSVPDVVISNNDMRRLDRISRRITCKTISQHYKIKPITKGINHIENIKET